MGSITIAPSPGLQPGSLSASYGQTSSLSSSLAAGVPRLQRQPSVSAVPAHSAIVAEEDES